MNKEGTRMVRKTMLDEVQLKDLRIFSLEKNCVYEYVYKGVKG